MIVYEYDIKEEKMNNELIGESADIVAAIMDEIRLKIENLPNWLNEIPGFGLIVNVLKTTFLISNVIYAKKYVGFVEQLLSHDISENSLYEMLKLYNKRREEFGEHLLMAIDKCDSERKAKLIAEITYSLLQHEIDYDEFEHYLNSVINMPFYVLRKFRDSFDSSRYITDQSIFGFIQANGFITMLNDNGDFILDATKSIDETYRLTVAGKKFGVLLRKCVSCFGNN